MGASVLLAVGVEAVRVLGGVTGVVVGCGTAVALDVLAVVEVSDPQAATSMMKPSSRNTSLTVLAVR